jgi:hypothetical protein
MTVFPGTSELSQGQALLRRVLHGINDAKALQVEGLGGKKVYCRLLMPQAQDVT